MDNILTMVLAGGKGTRLFPLCIERAKPAVPFGGRYRIIDFVLSNLINSGFSKIKILTQFKSDSLMRHLSLAWNLPPILGGYIDPVPPQMKIGEDWYRGSADAVYQNLNLIYNEHCDYVCIFGADHIYKMDVRQMLDYHKKKNADLTVASIPVPISEAGNFGIIEIDRDWKIVGFEEKPKEPKCIPGMTDTALASMGNYIFNTNPLIDNLLKKGKKGGEDFDFGKDILPEMFTNYSVYAYDFNQNTVPGMTEQERGYWRDVGSIDSYWHSNMDLVSVSPIFNLYNEKWPIRTYHHPFPPAKFVFAYRDEGRVGIATDSMVSEGCIISGGQVERSILSPKVRINSFSHVSESILLEGVSVGRYSRVKRSIIDKYVVVPSNINIGYNIEEDSKKFYVSPSGIVVIPKNTNLENMQ